jgi:hypothetical protein
LPKEIWPLAPTRLMHSAMAKRRRSCRPQFHAFMLAGLFGLGCWLLSLRP